MKVQGRKLIKEIQEIKKKKKKDCEGALQTEKASLQ